MTMQFINLQEELLRRCLRMASQVEEMLQNAGTAIFDPDASLAFQIIEQDNAIDDMEVKIEKDVIRAIALNQPVGRDLRLLCSILKVNSTLEGIADSTVNIAERASHLVVQPLAKKSDELQQMVPAVRETVRNAIQAFADADIPLANQVIHDDSIIDALYGQIVKTTVATADRSIDGMSAHLDMLSIAKNLERIGDQANAIAKDTIYVETGKIVRHRTPT